MWKGERMNNSDMKPGRYLRWHRARVLVAQINEALGSGATVQLTTALQVTRYTAKHAGMFRATRTGAYVQHGKRWDCIDYCKVTAYR